MRGVFVSGGVFLAREMDGIVACGGGGALCGCAAGDSEGGRGGVEVGDAQRGELVTGWGVGVEALAKGMMVVRTWSLRVWIVYLKLLCLLRTATW